MKVRSLFYFITFICFTFFGCKKEEVTPTTIVGQWYVERYTVYSTGSSYSSGYYEYEPTENYESVGLFNFKDDGTGVYTFENQTVPFTYDISESSGKSGSSSSFNGISISPDENVNSNVINLKFDKSAITSLRSPILENYYTYDLERYEVFTRTKGMLRFRGVFNYYSYSTAGNVEFVMTKQ